MASQIYSRYIPPPKKLSASNLSAMTPSATAITPHHLVSTPTPTHQDASSSYARYVPAPKTSTDRPAPSGVPAPDSFPTSKRNRDEVVDELVSKRSKQDNEETQSRRTRDTSHERPESKERIAEVRDVDTFESPAGLQKLREVCSTPSLEAAGQDDGERTTNPKKNKRKKERKRYEVPSGPAPVDQFSDGGVERSPQGLHTPNTKTRKHDHARSKIEVDTDGGIEAEKGNSRHKKLMEKREKSLKKAENLTQKGKTKSAGKDIEPELAAEIPAEIYNLVPLPQPDPVSELPMLPTALSLPSWLSSPIRVSPTATASFLEVGIGDDVAKVLQERGFNEAFAIQAAVLPLLLPAKLHQPGDVLVSAATGTGKTLAYVLPMIEDISRKQTTRLRGLIIMPTRELVTQAKEVCEICASAFLGGSQRRRLKIGTAIGNETLKVEQTMLMDQELLYNPVEYEKQQLRFNSKWEDSGCESDEELICDEEVISTLPDHVLHPISKVDILICTPGRLVEHVKSTPGFTLESVKWLVVDEADKLLDQSFQQWLEVVMTGIIVKDTSTRPRDMVRKIVLSATMTRDIGLLNPLKLYRPKLVVLEGSSSSEDSKRDQVSQAHVLPSLLLESSVKVEDESIKPLYLMELLKRGGILSSSPLYDSFSTSDFLEHESSSDEPLPSMSERPAGEGMPKPESDAPRGALIFTKSNESAVRLGRLIALLAPASSRQIGTLTSTTPRATRKSTLRSFAAGKMSILVASDLVSRGLDLSNLANVVNYDIPTSLTNYVHRIGRTARAGKQGHAWTLYTAIEGRWFWNEIGRTQGVERSRSRVERLNIQAEIFRGEQRRKYEKALETLGREAQNFRARM